MLNGSYDPLISSTSVSEAHLASSIHLQSVVHGNGVAFGSVTASVIYQRPVRHGGIAT